MPPSRPIPRSVISEADTIVVPGISNSEIVTHGRLPAALVDLAATARPEARWLSICTGAFVLAGLGKLDGRAATTHWVYADLFRRHFPEVRLDPDVLYVDHGDVLTSAGNAAGIDLLLHVLRSDLGSDAANRVARGAVVAPWRGGRPGPVHRATGARRDRRRAPGRPARGCSSTSPSRSACPTWLVTPA